MVMPCWSGWVVLGQLSSPFAAQGRVKFQYGPIAFQVAPPSLVSKISSSPR